MGWFSSQLTDDLEAKQDIHKIFDFNFQATSSNSTKSCYILFHHRKFYFNSFFIYPVWDKKEQWSFSFSLEMIIKLI
jgi:hypothetical protein